MLLRTSSCLLSGLAFSLIAATADAQGQKPHAITTPVESLKGDPVQGGAQSEYFSPSGPASGSSHDHADKAHRYGAGNASPERHWPMAERDRFDTRTMPPPAPVHELAVQSENGVRWLCGGIGEREVEYMKKEARRFDWMFTFATVNGAYLADVEVRIIDDNKRTVLKTLCGGPIMLLELPDDRTYRIEATVENRTVSRMLHLTSEQKDYRQIVMTWPSE